LSKQERKETKNTIELCKPFSLFQIEKDWKEILHCFLKIMSLKVWLYSKVTKFAPSNG